MNAKTPDYGEPWNVGRIDRPIEDRHGHDPLMLHSTASRAVLCVNAFAGMADPAAEIQEMRESIREAHKIIQVLYMDALDHHKESWPRANEWMEKHKSFTTQEP